MKFITSAANTLLTALIAVTMATPAHLTQAQTLSSAQGRELTASLTELLTAVKGLQAALASAPTGQVLGVSIANNAPVIDGETYTVTGPGEIIRGTEGVDKVVVEWSEGLADGQGIDAINRRTSLGQELGLSSLDEQAYIVYAYNTAVTVGDSAHTPSYLSIHENRSSRDDDTPIADTALEAALAFGTIVLDVEVIEGSDALDRFSPRHADVHFIPHGGHDYINAGGGESTVQFDGALSEYTIVPGTRVHQIEGPQGRVRASVNIDTFLFTDGAYTPAEAIAILNREGEEVTEETESITEEVVRETVEETEEPATEEQPEEIEEAVAEVTAETPATEAVEPETEVVEENLIEPETTEEVEVVIIETVLEASLELPEQSATPDVAVTEAISDTPTPTPDFQPNSTITLSDNVNVRDPYGLQGRITGIQPAGSQGTIIDITPQDADGYTWIPVDFQAGPDGWVASDFTDYDPTIEVDADGFTILALQNPDSTIITFENIAEADLPTEDTEYDYPHGLHDFTLEVEPNSTETVTIYLEAEINTNDKEIRKYNPDTEEYETITDQVTFGTADLADTTVTTLTYDVIDNGPLDNDPRVGFIVDPVGVGEEVMMGMHTPDLSGLTDNDHNTHDAGTTLHEEHDVLFDLMPYADATHIAAQSGAWSDPATWQHNAIPGDDARVIIPEDITVTYGTVSDARLFTVRVDGNLHFSTTEDSQMIVDTLASGVKSEFYIGTESNPVPENVTVDIIIANNGDIDTTWDTELISRGVILHGETKMHGHEKTTHGKVSVDPMAGDTSITMKEAPSEWGVGDVIVVAGSRFPGWHWDNTVRASILHENEDEIRTISSISGRTISFSEPLVKNHNTPRADLKVSVGNYTRNITITTEDPDSALIHERGTLHADALG